MTTKEHKLDCYSDHEHEQLCCASDCWCTQQLPEGLCRLEDVVLNMKFECPWNGKTFVLKGVTPSAAWVEVVEEREFEVRVKKTGEIKMVKTKTKKNEPWSRKTIVRPV